MHARSALLVLLVVVLAVPSTTLADVPAARLTVSGVTVAPTDPVVGEPVTVSVTVTNSLASGSAVVVRQVELNAGRGPDRRTLAETFDLGALSPGDALSVPLVVTFDEAGARTPTVRVLATDAENERVEVFRPVPVVVADAPPLVEVEVGDAAVDSPVPVAVRLANPTTAPVRNVVVTLEDAPGDGTVDRRTVARIAAGAVETVDLEFVPAATGEATVSVLVTYLTASGAPAAVSASTSTVVAPFVDDVGIAVRPAPPPSDEPTLPVDVGDLSGVLGGALGGDAGDAGAEEPGPGSASQVEVVVTNFGTVRVDDAVLTPVAGETTLPRSRLDGPLAPGESTTVVVDLAPVRADATVDFRLAYDAGVRSGAASATYEWRPPRGEIRVTDVDVGETDGLVTVRGNVANVGRAEATGLVVEVTAADGVRPVYPARDYFVGTVGGSDFAPFELTAVVDAAGPVTLPLRVTYQVDGERFVVETTVEYVPEEPATGGLGALPSTALSSAALLVVGIAVLVVPALAYTVRRRGPGAWPFGPRDAADRSSTGPGADDGRIDDAPDGGDTAGGDGDDATDGLDAIDEAGRTDARRA